MAFEGFDGHPYTRDGWLLHVRSIPKERMSWVKFLVLHNTGSPTGKQWQASKQQQRIYNLRDYYTRLGWHQGPHGFIDNDEIWGFSPMTEPGVHASCFNHTSLGFEMAIDLLSETFDDAYGSALRDNAAYALACIYDHLGLDPRNYIYGVKGLHVHKNCVHDHHDCPGKHFDYDDMVRRIVDHIQKIKGVVPVTTMKPVASIDPAYSELATKLASIDQSCSKVGQYKGLAVPRTCKVCSLGPCHYGDIPWRKTGDPVIV